MNTISEKPNTTIKNKGFLIIVGFDAHGELYVNFIAKKISITTAQDAKMLTSAFQDSEELLDMLQELLQSSDNEHAKKYVKNLQPEDNLFSLLKINNASNLYAVTLLLNETGTTLSLEGKYDIHKAKVFLVQLKRLILEMFDAP